MNLELKDQVAFVTAASRGLGKAAAMELAREGARIAMCARSPLIHTAADEIRAATGADVLALQADVTRQEDIEQAVSAAIDRFGGIDILITNSAGPRGGSFLELAPADWEAAFQLTVMSTVRLCYAVLPHMLAKGSGSIVAIQSYAVKQPIENLMLSNSLRLAVIGMVKSLANELGPKGIRVNSINPAWTWTERVVHLMTDRANRAGTTVEIEAEKQAAEIALKRFGSADEFGRTIAWLASPAASFIHGHALMFDGGIIKAAL